MPDRAHRFLTRLVDGDHAFLEWEAQADEVTIDDGADSFVIQDGLIRAQTIHHTVRHRTGYHERIEHRDRGGGQ